MNREVTANNAAPAGLLPSFKPCYFCGTGNPSGFGTRYAYDPGADRVTGQIRPGESYCSFPGVLHGGVQSAFLDDIMYWAVSYRTATSAVTVDLSCRYRRPAILGQNLTLNAWSGEPVGRKIRAEAHLLDEAGTILADATSLYILHPREDFVSKSLPLLDFEGCSGAMVDHFTRGRSADTSR